MKGAQFNEYSESSAIEKLNDSKKLEVSPGTVAEIFFYIHSRHPNQTFSHKAFNIERDDFWAICNMAEHERIRHFFNDFDDILLDLLKNERETLKNITEIWSSTIIPKKYSLKINLNERLEALSYFFSHLKVELQLSSFTVKDTHDVVKRDSIRRRRNQVRPYKKYALNFDKLLNLNPASINCERDLQKILFILTTWFRFKEQQYARDN